MLGKYTRETSSRLLLGWMLLLAAAWGFWWAPTSGADDEMPDGALAQFLVGSKGFSGPSVQDVAFSSDSKMLAGAFFYSFSMGGGDVRNRGDVRVWPLTAEGKKDGVNIICNADDIGMLSVAFHPQGKGMASGSFDNSVRLWDLPAGKVNQVFVKHQGPVNGVQFRPDGKQLASFSSDDKDRLVRLWNLEERTYSGELKGKDRDTISQIAYAPDGKTLAVGYQKFGNRLGQSSGPIRIFDVETEKEVALLDHHQGRVNDLVYIPGTKQLASVGKDRVLLIWDLEKKKVAKTIKKGRTRLSSLAVSPDGKYLAVGGSDRVVSVYQVGQWEKPLLDLRGHRSAIISLAFSPDNKKLASGSLDRSAIIWDFAAKLKEK